jgi:hypothetical protein
LLQSLCCNCTSFGYLRSVKESRCLTKPLTGVSLSLLTVAAVKLLLLWHSHQIQLATLVTADVAPAAIAAACNPVHLRQPQRRANTTLPAPVLISCFLAAAGTAGVLLLLALPVLTSGGKMSAITPAPVVMNAATAGQHSHTYVSMSEVL